MSTASTIAAPELSESEFKLFSRLIHERSGIHLGDQKIPLVRARLLKRLRALGLSSFRKYYELVTKNDETGLEEIHLLDSISTNLTQFFREPQHFDYLKRVFFARWKNEPQIRILSAGCSTGEEPYSIAIAAREFFGEAAATKVRIDAGDICTRVLNRAMKGIYKAESARSVSMERLRSSFLRGTGHSEGLIAVAPEVKKLVLFRYLNLMRPLEAEAPYHAIFCRNVAIYFDRETQQALFTRFANALTEGGVLLLGHSESMTCANPRFGYVQPAVYERRA